MTPLLPADFTQPSLQTILRINLDGTRVFSLGFVIVGRSFLLMAKRKEQPFSCVKIAALSWCILLLSRRYLPDKLELSSQPIISINIFR